MNKIVSRLTKRIIPCLDVKDGKVVKGVKFKGHVILGEVLDLAKRYRDAGADELVFYDITASVEGRAVGSEWIEEIAKTLDIPFCVAGGIRSIEDARRVFNRGADKISVNSPALENPDLINTLADVFGSQAIVVGIDSTYCDDDYYVFKYTGKESTSTQAGIRTLAWAEEVEARGAGEIVLNSMDADGTKAGFDLKQLALIRAKVHVPLIASGGAGKASDFLDLFRSVNVDGGLAAGIFHRGEVAIPELKAYLRDNQIAVREGL